MMQDRAQGTDGPHAADEVAEAEGLDQDAAESVADETPTAELEALRAQAAESQDNYLRALAEVDNVRKRAARDVEAARRYGLERFAGELLPVRDCLEAGIAAAGDEDAGALREGIEATLRLLDRVLEQFGISEIDPLGEPFDPEKHEAMTMQPSAEAEPHSVLVVIQKGYQINDRLLRPARVVVCSGPPATESQ